MDISRLNYFEILIRCIVLQATDSCGSIKESESLFHTERHDFINFEALGLNIHEMILVAKEYLTLNPPMIVDEVGIIKVHAPSLALWRKTAQKQHPRILRQERTERMVFHTVLAPLNIIRVKVGKH